MNLPELATSVDRDKARRGERFDPEIQGVVIELNRQGYGTEESCAGHFGVRGYIEFTKLRSGDKKRIKAELKHAGLKYVRFEGNRVIFEGTGGHEEW